MWTRLYLENPPLADKISLFPLRKPPCSGILLPRALLAPRRAPPATARQPHPWFIPLVTPSPVAHAQAAILPLAPIKALPEALSSPPQPQLRRAITRTWTHRSASTLPKPTLPSPSLPHTKAARPVPAPSSSLERCHHHPHPLSAPCHRRQAASVHHFATQGHKQVRFVSLLPLPPSPLAVGNLIRQNLAGRRCFPAQRTLLLRFQYFREDFHKISGTHL
jgi:hypothetical protein